MRERHRTDPRRVAAYIALALIAPFPLLFLFNRVFDWGVVGGAFAPSLMLIALLLPRLRYSLLFGFAALALVLVDHLALGPGAESQRLLNDGIIGIAFVGFSIVVFLRERALERALDEEEAAEARLQATLERAEGELSESLKELTEIKTGLDRAVAVAFTDTRGVITSVNDRFCEVSGYAREELVGHDYSLLNSGHHPEEFMRALWRQIQAGEIWHGEIKNRRKDGTFFWVETTVVPLLDAGGRPKSYLALHQDVTERRVVEGRQRRQESLARLGEMAAVVAHEVKNPLAGIAGAVQVIGSRLAAGTPEREAVTSILERIDALDRLIGDILTFARQREPRLIEVSLRDLIAATAGALERDAAFSEVEVVYSGEDCTIAADPQLLQTAILNLLLNAGQAMGGRGTVRVHVEPSGDDCRVFVEDSGPGIPPAVRELVFEPFFTTKHRGTGLGLTVAQQMVESHGGSIEIECPAEGGTRIVLRLPRQKRTTPGANGPGSALQSASPPH